VRNDGSDGSAGLIIPACETGLRIECGSATRKPPYTLRRALRGTRPDHAITAGNDEREMLTLRGFASPAFDEGSGRPERRRGARHVDVRQLPVRPPHGEFM
jgi:hypothetical protein